MSDEVEILKVQSWIDDAIAEGEVVYAQVQLLNKDGSVLLLNGGNASFIEQLGMLEAHKEQFFRHEE